MEETEDRLREILIIHGMYGIENVNEAMQQILILFGVIPSLQQDDSYMLFHECPNCNCRCNCTDQPCSCCNDV